MLSQVDFILAEDTRYSRKLLNHLGLRKRVISYYQPKEEQKIPGILDKLRAGLNGALITNCGTPLLSDPGFPLVRALIHEAIQVIPVPGPSAALPALIVSGIPADHFLFMGFPPKKGSRLERELKKVKDLPYTMVFYQSPERIEDFMIRVRRILGNRRFCIAREISKKNEKIIRGDLFEYEKVTAQETLRGELVVVLEGGTGGQPKKKVPDLNTRQDIMDYFHRVYGIPRNRIRDIIQRKR